MAEPLKYLAGRQSLRRAFVLIDGRHGIKKVDTEIMSMLDSSAVTFQVILTKLDKVKEKDREEGPQQTSLQNIQLLFQKSF